MTTFRLRNLNMHSYFIQNQKQILLTLQQTQKLLCNKFKIHCLQKFTCKLYGSYCYIYLCI